MPFIDNIKRSVAALFFNEKLIVEISNDEKATNYGFLTLVIAGIASAIATLDPIGLIIYPISIIISFFVGYSIYHLIAKFLLGGQATGVQYFRALSNVFVVYWFTFIPIIGIFLQFIAGLWILALNIFILNKVHKLSMVKAVLLGLLPIIVLVLIVVLFSGIFLYMLGSKALLS
ncbi:MAG: YIP1 family protein [Candidatus Altiarchaeota archaeon]